MSRPLQITPAVHGASVLIPVLCAINRSRRKGRARPRPLLIREVPRTPLPPRGSLRSRRWVSLRGVGPGKQRPSLLPRAGSPDRFRAPCSLRSLPPGENASLPGVHASKSPRASCPRPVVGAPSRSKSRSAQRTCTAPAGYRGSRSAALHSAPWLAISVPRRPQRDPALVCYVAHCVRSLRCAAAHTSSGPHFGPLAILPGILPFPSSWPSMAGPSPPTTPWPSLVTARHPASKGARLSFAPADAWGAAEFQAESRAQGMLLPAGTWGRLSLRHQHRLARQ